MATHVDAWAVNTLTSATGISNSGSSGILSSSTTGKIGYTTGAGSSATQATSKSTTVAFNALCGDITMNGAALAADAIVSFTFTNTSIAALDYIGIFHSSAGTKGAYIVTATPAAGSALVTVTNVSAGSLSEAIVLRFVVIKSVAS